MTAPKDTTTKTKTRTRRTRRVETPGQDEVKEPSAPLDAVVEQEAINQAPANVALGAGVGSDDGGDITDIVSEAGRAGQLNVHHRKEPQIGDKWAGMTLTADGWVSTEALEKEGK